MVSLTFYGGVKEIGGNKILLDDHGTKIFLDFGMSFSRRGKYFEEFLNPRTANGIGDFLEMGLLPDIPGIYRTDLLEHYGKKPEEPVVSGIVLSHAHADHANYISFLHKDIPIYCGETCKRIIDAVAEQTTRDLENEVIDFRLRPLYRSRYKIPPVIRKFHTFTTGKKFKIDSIEVEPIHVDHCLSPDTIIQLSNGELTKIENVKNSTFLISADYKEGSIVQALAFKSKYQTFQIFKIKTRFGEIKSTGEHRFFVLNGLNLIEKKAKELKKGDFLIYMREIKYQGKHQNLPQVTQREIITVSKKGLSFIKQKRKEKRLQQRQLAEKAGLSKFYNEFESGRNDIDIKNLVKILKILHIGKKLFIKTYCTKGNTIKIPQKTSPDFLQLLGYVLGDGSWNAKSTKSPYLEIGDKDKNNLELYQRIAKSLFNTKGKIVKKHTNILQFSNHIGKLFYKISPSILSKAYTRKIPCIVHRATLKEIASFLRGFYDAEGSFGHHAIILTSTSKEIIDIIKLLFLRFKILSWTYKFEEPISKRKAYHLYITHYESIINFQRKIGFGSEAKQKKLKNFIEKNKPSSIERIDLIPWNGENLKKALTTIKLSTWDFQICGIHITHYSGGKHFPSRSTLKRIMKFLKKCKKGDIKEKEKLIVRLEKILSLPAVFVPINSIRKTDSAMIVYDFEVPGYSNFIANGLIVHNSVPGAYGFIINTSEGALIYTGDLRMHGLHGNMTDDFAAAAQQAKPIAMITEGTRIDKKKTKESEQKIYYDSKQKIRQRNTLSIVDFNFKDIDRFTTFYKIAKDLGKILVINFKHACFLEQYGHDKKLKVPSINDPNLALLKPKRLTGTYIDEDYTDTYIKKRLHYQNIVTATHITKNPSKYMIILNFWYFSDLIDLKPKNGLYIHSLSEPFNEEMEISYDRMKNWLRHFDIEFFQSHCSGHINGDDLKELITTVHPKKLYPIHTEHPELFQKLTIKTTMVKEGKTYKL